ncbi:hypothetical protein C8J57DRAFT_1390410 [Mycena rebaudengoi]|nr:hypothetical protein C8J57DRAFT_1390410 [Mycena rebaudengoi]
MSQLPPFTPTRNDVLLIQSWEGMAGGGIGLALLFNPQNKDAGILVNHSGKMADVPAEKWATLQTLVTEALQIVMQGGASWGRPQMRSCPSGSYYDLRPGVDSDSLAQASGFARFTVGGYMVRQRDAPILRYIERGRSEPVEKIPDAILELERFLRVLPEELFPQQQDTSEAETPEGAALLDALEELANVQRSMRERDRIQARLYQRLNSYRDGLSEDGAES